LLIFRSDRFVQINFWFNHFAETKRPKFGLSDSLSGSWAAVLD